LIGIVKGVIYRSSENELEIQDWLL
jgi:hypothetical protein